jgi:L-threonylcarbamoyladenylate synthase
MSSDVGLSVRALDNAIEEAAQILRDGGVVAAPTDTLYGIMASALDAAAIARVFGAKGRSPDAPLPLLAAEVADIERYASRLPDVGRTLAEKFLPGPLTLVVSGAGNLPGALTGGLPTVGVRVPDHRVPRELARRLGHAITGTSANRSGMPPATTAAEVREQLGDGVDYVVDGGPTPGGVGSTVVDVSVDPPALVREGAIPWGAIEAALRDEDENGGRANGLRDPESAGTEPSVSLRHSRGGGNPPPGEAAAHP